QSVHTAFFARCVLWGNGIGCVAAGRMLKKSRAACPNEARAGVYTADDTFADGASQAAASAASQSAAAAHTGRRATRRRRGATTVAQPSGAAAALGITFLGGSGGS